MEETKRDRNARIGQELAEAACIRAKEREQHEADTVGKLTALLSDRYCARCGSHEFGLFDEHLITTGYGGMQCAVCDDFAAHLPMSARKAIEQAIADLETRS